MTKQANTSPTQKPRSKLLSWLAWLAAWCGVTWPRVARSALVQAIVLPLMMPSSYILSAFAYAPLVQAASADAAKGPTAAPSDAAKGRSAAPAGRGSPAASPRGKPSGPRTTDATGAPLKQTFLTVESTTKGANVSIDGIIAGQVNSQINTDPGKVRIEVSLKGYIAKKVDVLIAKNRANNITVNLDKPKPKPKPAPPRPAPPPVQVADMSQKQGNLPPTRAAPAAAGRRSKPARKGAANGRPYAPAPSDDMFAAGPTGAPPPGPDLSAQFNADAAAAQRQQQQFQQPKQQFQQQQFQQQQPQQQPQQQFQQPPPQQFQQQQFPNQQFQQQPQQQYAQQQFPQQQFQQQPQYVPQQQYAPPPPQYYAPPPQPYYPPPQPTYYPPPPPVAQPYYPPAPAPAPAPLAPPPDPLMQEMQAPAAPPPPPVAVAAPPLQADPADPVAPPAGLPRQDGLGKKKSKKSKSNPAKYAVALIPFGAGQFYNGRTLLGLTFLATEAGALGLWYYFGQQNAKTVKDSDAYNALYCNGQASPPPECATAYTANTAKAKTYGQDANYSLYAFGLVYAIGAIQAILDDGAPKEKKKKHKGRGISFSDNERYNATEEELADADEAPVDLHSFQWQIDPTTVYDQSRQRTQGALSLNLKWTF